MNKQENQMNKEVQHQLVPTLPTEQMLVAGLDECEPLGDLIDWKEGFGRKEMTQAYRAMLGAAPAINEVGDERFFNLYAKLTEAMGYESGKDGMEWSPEEWAAHLLKHYKESGKAANPWVFISEWRWNNSAGQWEGKTINEQAPQTKTPSRHFEDLLDRYWALAYQEGKTGRSHGDEANEVLFELRALLRQNQTPSESDLRRLLRESIREYFSPITGAFKLIKRMVGKH